MDFDYDEFERYGDDQEEEDEEEEDEYEEDGDVERLTKSKKKTNRNASRKSIFEIYEPSELRRGHFTDQDNEVCLKNYIDSIVSYLNNVFFFYLVLNCLGIQ